MRHGSGNCEAQPPAIFDRSSEILQGANAISYEHVTSSVESILLPVFLQPLQVVFSVGIATENNLPLIGPTYHLVKRPRIFHSRLRAVSDFSTAPARI